MERMNLNKFLLENSNLLMTIGGALFSLAKEVGYLCQRFWSHTHAISGDYELVID
jgi:hypothetical protein